jgi:hypothetical protein
MGNLEVDLSKYGCTCLNQQDGGFLDFADEIFSKATPFINNYLNEKEKDKNISKSNISTFTTQRMIPNQTKPNKNYESFTIVPQDLNNNLNIDNLKEENKNYKEESLFDDKNYLKEFEYSETEINQSNNENSLNSKKGMIKNDDIDNEDEEEEENEDINNFNSKTDYFQLATQISESIKELRNNIFNRNGSTPTPDSKNLSVDDFEKALYRAGKNVDNIFFNDVIGCIKKISDINSEVSLTNEKIYLALVNKFKKTYSLTHYINFSDEKKIVSIPNFHRIKPEAKAKLGKFNDPKFQFNKFTLKGSFPNEILIWKLISQNMKQITDIMKDNYYCCAVLLHKGKNEDENETIIYFINKIAK